MVVYIFLQSMANLGDFWVIQNIQIIVDYESLGYDIDTNHDHSQKHITMSIRNSFTCHKLKRKVRFQGRKSYKIYSGKFNFYVQGAMG